MILKIPKLDIVDLDIQAKDSFHLNVYSIRA